MGTARTMKDLQGELYGWPEEGGFRYDRLLELLAEYERRLEDLEQGRPLLACPCGWRGTQAAVDPGGYCPTCGAGLTPAE